MDADLIDIIIPAYRGFAELQACLNSVFNSENLGLGDVIVINDCSPDPEIDAYLADLAQTDAIILLKNPENVGFVVSCNRGASKNPRRDFILLNSDTLVHGDWLDRMSAHAVSGEKVASVTPFSNNATIASYPSIDPKKASNSEKLFSHIDSMMAIANSGLSVDLPTAVGFCMYVVRSAWLETGGFDLSFGRGYGEEVEFCCSTSKNGWTHRLACDVFVYHVGAVSFGSESVKLRADAQVKIDSRYPDFAARVDEWIKNDPALPARLNCDLYRVEGSTGPRILHLSHDMGGGVQQHIEDLAETAFESAGAISFVLQPWGEDAIKFQGLGGGTDLSIKLFTECAEHVIPDLMKNLGIQRVHFHHSNGLPRWVLGLADRLKLPLDVTVHDFVSICPHSHYPYDCPMCLSSELCDWGLTTDDRRALFGDFFASAQRLICPTEFVSKIICDFYPNLSTEVWAHPEKFVAELSAHKQNTVTRRKVAVLGGLSLPKGFNLVKTIIEIAEDRDLPVDFVLIGYATEALPRRLSKRVLVTGSYRHSDLPGIISRERPDCFLFASQVPETYSYTLTTALATGLPIVAISIGAFSERLRDVSQAVLMPMGTDAIDLLQILIDQPQLYKLVGEADESAITSFPTPQEYIYRYLDPVWWDTPKEIDTASLIELLLDLARDEPCPPDPPPIGKLVIDATDCRIETARAELSRQIMEMERRIAQRDEHFSVHLKEISHLHSVIRELKTAHLREEEHLHGQIAGLNEAKALEVDHLVRVIDSLKDAHKQALEKIESEHVANFTKLEVSHSDKMKASQKLFDAMETERNEWANRAREIESSTLWRSMTPLRVVLHFVKKSFLSLRVFPSFIRKVLVFSRYHFALNGWLGVIKAIKRRATFSLRRMSGGRDYIIDGRLSTLEAQKEIVFDEQTEPLLSILIPTFGKHEMTAECLRSIAAHPPSFSFEIIVIDDAFECPFDPQNYDINGVRVIRNVENLGFLRSCNFGAGFVTGDRILLLNNDTVVLKGALDALWNTFGEFPNVGAVGAKLLYPSGRLQEAGGIVWNDGSGWNWGRNEDPFDPRFNYVREVDYCSAAALMIDLDIWKEILGFDEIFMPCYYEDTDFCFSIREKGKRVFYQPKAEIIHLEGASHGTQVDVGQKAYQTRNQQYFLEKWCTTLERHARNGVDPLKECNRFAKARVLWVEACVLTPDQDSGSLRTARLLALLVNMGCKVTFVADNLQSDEPYCENLRAQGIEVLHAPYVTSIKAYLRRWGGLYDVITFCRHYIAVNYVDLLREHHPQTCIWFDTVDLHYLRLDRQYRLDGQAATKAMAELARAQELEVINKSDLTIVVSDVEKLELASSAATANVSIISNIHEIQTSKTTFEGRSGIMFVGGFQHPPNIDAVEYYAKDIWPLFRARYPDVDTYIIGSRMPESLKKFGENRGLTMVGYVDDLDTYYQRCVIAIAPLRYGAGIKGKVNQAVSYGIPVVASTVAIEGMHLKHGREVMEASNPQAFANAMIDVYSDPTLWKTLSTHGRKSLEGRFTTEVAERALSAALSSFFGKWDAKAIP